jgi:hypothetical protein
MNPVHTLPPFSLKIRFNIILPFTSRPSFGAFQPKFGMLACHMLRPSDHFITLTVFGKGKGKVVPVIFLTQHNAMKAYWGSGGIAPLIL